MSAAGTIAALATGPARGGIAVLRVSGPRALEATLPLASAVPALPEPRHAYFTPYRERSGAVLDEGLFLYFAPPRSFTGEPVVELQLHGSPELAALLLREVLADGEVRLAEPGEFTRRAFLNGRIDLLRAEAVADLVEAQSAAQVRAAAAQLSGAASEAIARVRSQVADLLTDLEGVLNFPEEAEEAEAALPAKLSAVLDAAASLEALARQGQRSRGAGRVTLYGAPNAGKSTLFNRLLGSDRALVDAEPGTTRDVLEAPWSLGGLNLTLVDTAGLRETTDRVESMGVERALAALRTSDLALHIVAPDDASDDAPGDVPGDVPGDGEAGGPGFVVRSKADRLPAGAREAGVLYVSAETGEGLESLRARVLARLSEDAGARTAFSARALLCVEQAAHALAAAHRALAESTLEVVAGEVAGALESLDAALGREAPADVLDAVFQRFCVGK